MAKGNELALRKKEIVYTLERLTREDELLLEKIMKDGNSYAAEENGKKIEGKPP